MDSKISDLLDEIKNQGMGLIEQAEAVGNEIDEIEKNLRKSGLVPDTSIEIRIDDVEYLLKWGRQSLKTKSSKKAVLLSDGTNDKPARGLNMEMRVAIRPMLPRLMSAILSKMKGKNINAN